MPHKAPPTEEADWAAFPGFDAPRYTQVPDITFDYLLRFLPHAEFKCLLYIVRRTFGFKKDADTITIDQFIDGVRRRDGTRLDWGTGFSRSTVHEALRGLEQKNLITVIPGEIDAVRGTLPNTYRLRMVGGGYGPADPRGTEDRTRGVRPSGPQGYGPADPQETVPQETGNNKQPPYPPGQQTGEHDEAARLWSAVLSDLQGCMTPENFAHWFTRATPVSLDESGLVIATGGEFEREWMQNKMHPRIAAALERQGYQGAVTYIAGA